MRYPRSQIVNPRSQPNISARFTFFSQISHIFFYFNYISVGIENCPALVKLTVAQNPIDDIKQFQYLKSLQRLRVLSFANPQNHTSCPVCKDSRYTATLLSILPNLQRLDGILVQFSSLPSPHELIKESDERLKKMIPPQSWIVPEDAVFHPDKLQSPSSFLQTDVQIARKSISDLKLQHPS